VVAVTSADYKIYVDASVPATLNNGTGISTDCATLEEAVLAWQKLAPEQKIRATVRVIGGRAYKSSGVGMGLSICRSIIDAHGGQLWAEANGPRGRRISVHFAQHQLAFLNWLYAGLSSLNEGQVVEYEEVSDRGKTSAGNLRVRC
jgi:hypothetical protein